MGIFLNLTVYPQRIPEDQWERTYEEALRIADHCDLLDRVFPERNGRRYAAARKTAERDFPEDGPGICVCGTMDSGYDMEEFYLFRQKPRCRGSDEPDNGADPLFEGWYPEDPDIPVPTGACWVWGAKTQGRPGHVRLLAIACLFADRFPEAVNIGGDVTAGQCRAAVKLANRCLDRPVRVPVTCRAEVLIRRLRRTEIPAAKQMAAFFQLYRDRLTPEVGSALKEGFPEGELYRYFRERTASGTEHMADLERAVRDYLLLDLNPAELLKMLTQDPLGARMPLEELLSQLFACRVHIPLDQKNCTDPLGLDAAVEGDLEAPHEIEALMGRAFFAMFAGRNRTLPVYLPPDTLRAACRQLFPHTDTDALIDHLLANPAEDKIQDQIYGPGSGALLNRMEKDADEYLEQAAAYDLREPNDLRRWRPGLTIEPQLEGNLLELVKAAKAFPLEKEYQDFLNLPKAERENDFIRRNRYVLLCENTWDHIFNHVMDDPYICRFFRLFRVDCSSKVIHDLMSPLLANLPLIDFLWEQTPEASKETGQ